MILDMAKPYERALLKSLSVRIEAARELLTTDKVDKYRSWWLSMRRRDGEKPSDAEADKFALLYRDFSRKVVEEGYNPEDENPIKITISADGSLSCHDGNHRLCALAASGEEIVEVAVGWVSPSWTKMLKALSGRVYQPHPHPSFAGWTCTRPDTAQRYAEIARRLVSMGCQSVFEIGSCAGVGVQAMAREGLSVAWAETDPNYARLCKSLSVKELSTGVVETLHYAPPTDAVVGLAVWHHVATSLEAFKAAAEILADARVQVIELPTAEAPRWHDRYVQESGQTFADLPEWTLDLLYSIGNYSHREVLRKEAYGGRTTWIMWRD